MVDSNWVPQVDPPTTHTHTLVYLPFTTSLVFFFFFFLIVGSRYCMSYVGDFDCLVRVDIKRVQEPMSLPKFRLTSCSRVLFNSRTKISMKQDNNPHQFPT